MKEDILNSPSRVPHVGNSESENALATFFDVAVLRCLFISHWPEDGVYWALIFFHKRYDDYSYLNDKYDYFKDKFLYHLIFHFAIRLKGIACTDSSEGRSAPTRFRSNSVPIPKIEVTICGDEAANDANKTIKETNEFSKDNGVPEICIEDEDDEVFGKGGSANLSGSNSPDGSSRHHIRSISMREGLKKKRKSIIHTIHADTKWKNFKSIVESKIMSKSNMALESEELETTTKQGLIRKRTCEGRFHGSVSNVQDMSTSTFNIYAS